MLALANKESLVVGGPLVTGAGRGRGRSWPSTPSTRRWPNACGPGRPTRSPAGPDREWRPVPGPPPGAAGRRHAGEALVHPPGRWDGSSPSTRPRWSTRDWSCGRPTCCTTSLDRVDVVVHPQSVVHSMVEFVDGSTLGPVLAAGHAAADRAGLGWPDRLPEPPRLRLDDRCQLELRTAGPPGVPRGRARPPGRPPSARPRRRCTTPPTRNASTRSTPAGSASTASCDIVGAVLGRARDAARINASTAIGAKTDVGSTLVASDGSERGDRAGRRRVGPRSSP